MKKQLLILAISFITSCAFAQTAKDKEKEVSNSDKFALKTGVLLQKNSSEIGKFKSVTVELIEVINLMDKSKIKSLRMTIPATGDYSSDHVGVIDNDEVDGLIKSLELIQSNAVTVAPSVYTEVSYKSRSGFEAGAYYSNKDSAWKYYLQMSKYDGKSYQFFSATELADLLTLLKTAKAKLL